MNSPSSRKYTRRRLRNRRRELSSKARRDLAQQAAARLLSTPAFLKARRIGGYLANDSEMDPGPILDRAWKMGKHCYLPVLRPFNANRLWFATYHRDAPLVRNRYGIPEPRAGIHAATALASLDLILVPLVAVDLQGNRLGMGGGFYDRTFAFLRRRARWHKPRLIGLAYDFQIIESIEPEPWDIRLDLIVTDRGVYRTPPD